MKASKFSSVVTIICIILSACGGSAPTPPVNSSPTESNPVIKIDFIKTEAVELVTETVSQPNCEGTAEVENQVQKSRTVEHIIEAMSGVSVNTNGQIGFAGTDVELGLTVAQQLGTSYGTAENISKSVTVKAKPGTNMQHILQLVEIWKIGNADIKVGEKQTTVPFRFRNDFAIQLVSSKDIGCPGQTATPVFASATPLPPSATLAGMTATKAQPTSPGTPGQDTGWEGKYYANNNFQEPAAYIRADPAPIFDWKEGNPAPDVPIDQFSVRWTRCLTLEDRYYIFSARADDYVKILVDDLYVLEARGNTVQREFAVSAGEHCIKVEYVEAWDNASVYFDFKPGKPNQSAEPGTAWRAEYFNNNGLEEPAAYTREDEQPIFDWESSNPAPAIPIDQFSVRWTRCYQLEDRYYVFTARADDYVKVFVDDIFVLEARGNNVERAFAIAAGQRCIKVEYIEAWDNASIYFDFKPGDAYPSVDPSSAWQGEYFNNANFQEPPILTRDDSAPVFNWKDSNPAPGIPIDQFSVRWTQCLNLEGREYTFIARADDFVRVFVDDNLVLEARGNNVEKPFNVSAGNHCIKIEYQEAWDNAMIYFGFK